MATLNSFSTPANIQDLQSEPTLQEQLNQLWDTNVNGFTQQAIIGDPWNSIGNSNQNYYYNALVTDIPDGTSDSPVTWLAFPNRISQYLGQNQSPPNPYNLSQEQLWELADTGYYTDNNGKTVSFPEIPVTLCPEPDWSSNNLHPYGPYGPRGWQDEYCEWSVVRNEQGKITRADFACENPEYWYSLWRISPETAAQVYQDTLNYGLASGSPQITVTVEDLQMVDSAGQPVIDPATGNPAYNPLNKWNRGTVSTRGAESSGGVMHLTSTPNTLQTEMGLAGAATVQRKSGNADPQVLICCSQYGQPFRHSDPHIGQGVNQAVSAVPGGLLVSLANPVGLYIQMPDFSVFQLPTDPNLPEGATAADCWQIVRGSETLTNPYNGEPFNGNFILHAVFQIPEKWIDAGVKFTVGDIQINFNGKMLPISWAAQIVETFHIGLFALPIPATAPAPQEDCVTNTSPEQTEAQPIQMMPVDLWNAYYHTPVDNPVRVAMSMASNTVIVPATVTQGQVIELALICLVTKGPNGEMPQVTVPEGDINFTSIALTDINYAAPGNSYPSHFQLLTLGVQVDHGAKLGLRNINLTNFGQSPGEPGPAFINVVASC
jgi:hypothetical protein